MRNFVNALASFANDESGQDLIEYSLVAALLSCAAISTLKAVATQIEGVFTYVTTQLSGAISSAA